MDQIPIESLADHLPGWKVRSARANASDMEVLVTSPEQAADCQSCGADGHQLIGYGFNISGFREAPIVGRRTLLSVRRRRHRCVRCNALGSQPLTLTDPGHRITLRCRQQIIEQACRLPLAKVAEQIGVNRAVVQSLAPENLRRSGRPRRSDRADLSQCQFCRRVFDAPVSGEVNHIRPTISGASPYAMTTLCRQCHAHVAAVHHEKEE